MQSELKPCPFCWGRARSAEAGPEVTGMAFIVECQKCKAGSGWHFKKAEAITAWNTRAERDALKAEIERLRGKLQYMADTNLADDEYRTIAREALAGKAEQ